MKTVCDLDDCTGCMACIDICGKHAISIQDNLKSYNAVIDQNKCVNCGLCTKVCQNNYKIQSCQPTKWYQGWTNDEQDRLKASSGGFATAIAKSFIKNKGIVYSCVFKNGEFIFESAKNENEVDKFTGSKYVKSNPINLYKNVLNDLKSGKKVLVIALPCQIGALKQYIKQEFQQNLYTVDLICHGTPSPNFLEMFLNQYNKSLKMFNSIIFRVKAKMQIHGNNEGIVTKGVSDKYTIAFLNGLTYTDNCYKCKYAKLERVSDITIGDSWGSTLSEDERKKGISLALCQTKKGIELLGESNLCLKDVDLNEAINNNHQLKAPSTTPSHRNNFFNGVKKHKRINFLIFIIYPRQSIKQDVKNLLIRIGVIRKING